jgi:hypothetical protein
LWTKSIFSSPFLLGENLARRNLRYITTTQLRRKASAKKARNGLSTSLTMQASSKSRLTARKLKSIAIFLAIKR